MLKINLTIKTLISVFAISLFLTTGCDVGKKETEVSRVKVIQGANQCAPANTEFKKELRVEFMGPAHSGILGGKGTRHPVEGIRVRFENIHGSTLQIMQNEVLTDAGGLARVKVKSGRSLGDQYLKVTPVDFPKKSTTIRFVSGVSIKGAKQEAYNGNTLNNPIQVEISDIDGKPISGVPVFFTLASSPEKKVKASLKKTQVLTDKDGIAETNLKMGNTTGTYKVLAEISAPQHKLFIRNIEIKEMGLNLTTLIITVLGGLAIFIYGMKRMSDGLQLVAGEKMKSILQFFTRNRFIAIFAGAMVTAVIQSSSACTVMVVGFVNAGLLNLTQAIGIIFGANIGTTITAQMIAFKLKGLALPAIIVGLLIMMLSKKTIIKGWGQTVFGFGFLFFGMSLMGNELKLIGTFPSFIEFFSQFNCAPSPDGHMPVLAILGAVGIGTAMTVMIQSSSATIGIALALAASGLINFYTAVPLILGDNIGTTITAMLASIGANKRAKQTAVGHILFNVLGTTYMILLFFVPYPGTNTPIFLYFINSITAGNVFAEVPENITRHIAMAHTFFNVFNVIVFLPLIGIIVRICNFVIPVKDEKSIKLQYLEPHLLDTPSVAIEQAIQSIRYMVKESWAMVKTAMDKAFIPAKHDYDLSVKLAEREEKIDALQTDVTDYLVQLTGRKLTEPQAEIVPLLMHCTNDAEKIADHTENILGLTKRLEATSNGLSETGKNEIEELWQILTDQAANVISCLNNTSTSNVNLALNDEKQINKLVDQLEEEHIIRLSTGDCDAVTGIIFIEILAELEKIGDHLSNIAERAAEVQKHHLHLG